MVTVNLSRVYGWHDEAGAYTEYGPGKVEIPLAMAEGLVKHGGFPASILRQAQEPAKSLKKADDTGDGKKDAKT